MSILPSLSTGLGVEASAPPAPKGVILLIEDETTIVTYLSVLLKRDGWRVLSAQEGRKAIELFTNCPEKVRLAIIDSRLPDMSGDSVCQELRSIDGTLPVLFCSGLLKPGGADAWGERTRFLAKPFSPAQILNDIHGLVEATSGI